MLKKIIFLGIVALGLPGAALATGGDTATLDAIQKKYDETRSFTAKFVQKSYLKIMGQSQEAKGEVAIQKPGKMKWDYRAPDRQILVSNDDGLWLYLPEENQVTKMQVESVYSSNTPALFLAGEGRLRESFHIESTTKDENGWTVVLMPKEADNNIDRLILFTDNSYQIVGSSVYDKLGNKTKMRFSNIQINPDISEETFQFRIPEGVEVIDFSSKP